MISPAKKMKIDTDTLEPKTLPVFLEQAQELLGWLRQKDYGELKAIWNCSDSIAAQNMERLERMDLTGRLTPAVLSYEGIQYQYMAPAVFEDGQWEYVEERVRILSGLYGILRPLDGVTPYRLEMQAKAGPEGDLYAFWSRSLYDCLKKETDCIINLASREYAVCVEKYLKEERGRGSAVPRYITCIFGEEKRDGKAGGNPEGNLCQNGPGGDDPLCRGKQGGGAGRAEGLQPSGIPVQAGVFRGGCVCFLQGEGERNPA